MALLLLGVQVELEFRVLGIVEGGKPEGLGKNPRSEDENQQQTQPTCDTRSGNRTQATVVGGEHSHHCAIDAPTNQSVARIVLKACFGMFDPITLTSYVFSQRILLFLFCFGLYCLLHRLQVRLASLLKILKTSKRFVEFHQHAL